MINRLVCKAIKIKKAKVVNDPCGPTSRPASSDFLFIFRNKDRRVQTPVRNSTGLTSKSILYKS